MRVEWAQCMARADCQKEEVILLQEEMRQVVQFLEWRSRDWLSKVNARAGATTSAVRTGLSAYAKRQASVFHNLAIRFSQRWYLMFRSLSPSRLGYRLLKKTWRTPDQSGFQETKTGYPKFKTGHDSHHISRRAIVFNPRHSTTLVQR